ncbi:uncharacterized protein FIESC28_08280 [Fusarium coffeatum]|uniref:BZIP domain-containing protein n=1 Tax=Fusarium coffeatum TaxID=231269 RepID=A0A366R834_9HYPO|nr:uncharacterized protein FIESC28_08280 [Fusarium coffeatum]RBR13314.1 hypothetical protein FIESC28_08280 [Fusarium coffeatum]
MSKNIFRIFNPGEPKENPVEKRRAQLRRAQQTYRNRKDRYTRTLEEELAKSRSKEAELMRENQQLRNALQQLSQQQGIGMAIDNTPDYAPSDSIALSRTAGSSNGTSPFYFSDMSSQPQNTMPSPQLISPEFYGTFPVPDNHDRAPILFGQGGVAYNCRVSDVDQVVAGMEFVLKIEEPCLDHLHGDLDKPFEPSNHALSASSQLMAACDYPSPTISSPPPISATFNSLPTQMLERLLSLAPDLSSEGEMTPIQAWNTIRLRPDFGGFDTRSLGALARKLKKAVKCHGFGAVVKEAVFEGLVYETLITGKLT